MCAHHDDRPAVARCWRCGRSLCFECHHPELTGFAACRRCPERGDAQAGTPWEDVGSPSALDAFGRTAFDALRSPSGFFGGLQAHTSWWPAFFFAMACIAVGAVFDTTWNFLFNEQFNAALVKNLGPDAPPLPVVRAMSYARIPLIAPLTFLMHLIALRAGLILGGVQRPDWALCARIVGFSCAAYLFLTVPSFGAWRLGGHTLMIFWVYNLQIAGMQRFFGVPPMRALFIALLPLLFTMQCI